MRLLDDEGRRVAALTTGGGQGDRPGYVGLNIFNDEAVQVARLGTAAGFGETQGRGGPSSLLLDTRYNSHRPGPLRWRNAPGKAQRCKMARVIHFEILADDPERASKFYRDTLGWDVAGLEGEMRYWLVTTGIEGSPGINGAIMDRHFPQPVINTVEVESLEETLAKIDKAGGKKVHGPNEIPGIGTHAYCADTEGNLFGVLQPAPVQR